MAPAHCAFGPRSFHQICRDQLLVVFDESVGSPGGLLASELARSTRPGWRAYAESQRLAEERPGWKRYRTKQGSLPPLPSG
jgi:hypothetical protein